MRSSPPSAPPEEPQELVGVQAGDILADKYRIDKVLGVGGMGIVVAAHHIHLDEKVAIKFLLPAAMTSGEIVARFAREARAAVKIKSEYVARVIDVGTLQTGAPYMVMEYLEGGDLDAWVRRRGPLAAEQAVEFILQACEAIAEAHSLGIIHRDLKPANLFCIRRPDGTLAVKVLDFGISKVDGMAASGQHMSMTKTSSMMGSPLYMSPEQMQSSRTVDVRADIWALGVVLYELLAGRAPFLADSIPELCMKVLMEAPPPLAEVRADMPAGLEEVILGCLQKDRNNRYATVAEFAKALAPFAPMRALGSIERIGRVVHGAASQTNEVNAPVMVGEVKPTAEGRTTAPWESMGPAPSAPRSKAIWMVAVAVLAIGAMGGVMFLRGRSSSSTGQAPSVDAAQLQSPVAAEQPAMANVPDAAVPAPVVAVSSAPEAASATAGKLDAPQGSTRKGKPTPSSASSKATGGSAAAATPAATPAPVAPKGPSTGDVFDDRR